MLTRDRNSLIGCIYLECGTGLEPATSTSTLDVAPMKELRQGERLVRQWCQRIHGRTLTSASFDR